MVTKRGILMEDPEREFHDPRHVLENHELSEAQKLQLLLNWRLDLLELERATEENMAASIDSGDVAEQLKKVTDALEELRATP